MVDQEGLRRAQRCIDIMKAEGRYSGERIGVVRERMYGLESRMSAVPTFQAGQVVLFTEEMEPSDSQLRMGEYKGMAQRPSGRVTVESPLTQKAIDEQRAKGSGIRTVGTMINVPRGYIEEVTDTVAA